MTDTTLHTTRSTALRGRRASLLDWLLTLARLYRSRQDLSRLDERMLEDIGVTQKQADVETKRAPWDVPAHWLQ